MPIYGNDLERAAEERPYPEYADWWQLGADFTVFMSLAILSEWEQTGVGETDLGEVQSHVRDYMDIAYGRAARADLVQDFVAGSGIRPLFSGEFDSLSYAFFRSAFDRQPDEQARRHFARQVGKQFFTQMASHLALRIPESVQSIAEFQELKKCIDAIGRFLMDQRYLRDHFAFKFDVDIVWQDERIQQAEHEFMHRLNHNGLAYAVYEMGYPVILPSAAYLFNTAGEAQHHSSRMIEELFERAGLRAAETHDFDPTKYDANLVVELWEIRLQNKG